jgi:hypothetical protein
LAERGVVFDADVTQFYEGVALAVLSSDSGTVDMATTSSNLTSTS